jgi:hypothetical protein
MELNKIEVNVIQDTIKEVQADQLRQLSDLQLALVGGGIADVIGG